MAKSKSHIVMLPPPGLIGHLIPFVELAKELQHKYNSTITLLIPTDITSSNERQKALLETLPSAINSIFLAPVSLDDLSAEDTRLETRVSHTIIRSLPAIREALNTITTTTNKEHSVVSALVVDMFAIFAFDVAKEFGISLYVFHITSAMDLALSLLLPKLDESHSCEYRDLPESVELPGFAWRALKDLPESMQDRNNEAYKWSLELSKKYYLAEGIIVNSFPDLETDVFEALLEQQPFGKCTPPIYPVGPLIQSDDYPDDTKCLSWLNDQPIGSVLFVSFGSGATVSIRQLKELAMGLEMSEQRFLWLVKSPHKNVVASYLDDSRDQSKTGNGDFLPDGFLERTKTRGLVLVDSWVPQVLVLKHRAIGCFVSQCGWNAVLEGVTNGVPIISWPLYFEQKMTASFLSDVLKVALRIEENEDSGIVERDQISKLAKEIMCLENGDEGNEIRRRMKDLKEAATKALSQDGVSSKSLANFVSSILHQ